LFIVVTGGGTGGHVYPALEVARSLSERGGEILFLGSLRGQERQICEKRAVAFQGFGSRPLYSLRSARGWSSLVALIRATGQAKAALRKRRPDIVFSTGGYSAAPVMQAAKSLGVPLAIHEANSIPGRSNRMFAPYASGFSCTFNTTVGRIKGAVRTGQPIRRELREAASRAVSDPVARPLVMCVGGSQGSQFLNEHFPAAARRLEGKAEFLLATGRNNFDLLGSKLRRIPGFTAVPYLEADALVDAYSRAMLAVGRSGGTVAEFAMFGLPSVLVPLPGSADDHQLKNAQEFVELGGASLLEQSDASPERLAQRIEDWLRSEERRERARRALKEWDIPDATDRIVEIVERAASRHN
jgi:UDP-N-acetylglucosamine--N-acetylmuramyl-(pentapeptide) pyrophosphoryl-undecaprenol N-acetylglucosamine transferase